MVSEKKLVRKVLCADFDVLARVLYVLTRKRLPFAVNYKNEDTAVIFVTQEGFDLLQQWVKNDENEDEDGDVSSMHERG